MILTLPKFLTHLDQPDLETTALLEMMQGWCLRNRGIMNRLGLVKT